MEKDSFPQPYRGTLQIDWSQVRRAEVEFASPDGTYARLAPVTARVGGGHPSSPEREP